MDQHLIHYVWMSKDAEAPIKVPVDEGNLTIIQHIKQGYVQAFPAEQEAK